MLISISLPVVLVLLAVRYTWTMLISTSLPVVLALLAVRYTYTMTTARSAKKETR
jgi:hypothetical protein